MQASGEGGGLDQDHGRSAPVDHHYDGQHRGGAGTQYAPAHLHQQDDASPTRQQRRRWAIVLLCIPLTVASTLWLSESPMLLTEKVLSRKLVYGGTRASAVADAILPPPAEGGQEPSVEALRIVSSFCKEDIGWLEGVYLRVFRAAVATSNVPS